MGVPDPYCNPAARAYMGICRDIAQIYMGWDVYYRLDGFRAEQGLTVLGPVSSPAAIGALLDHETRLRGDAP